MSHDRLLNALGMEKRPMKEFYTAKCRGCGAVVAACVDKPEYAMETSADVAEWVKRGDLVEHIKSDKAMSVEKCRCET